MVILKEITEHSWIVLTDEEKEKIGLLSATPNGTFTLLSKEGKVQFENREKVLSFFEEDVFHRVVSANENKDQQSFIKSFPIDYATPVEADFASDLPLFKKTKSSKVHFCAGYYCLKFPRGWIHSFCPKFSTVEKYEYAGPFKTKTEMKAHLSILRRNDK